MKRRFYLGLNAGGPGVFKTLFTRGSSQDLRKLSEFLSGKYKGATILTKNGRSALCLALLSYLDPGDKVIVCGFTCYAVYEAVVQAGMTPVFSDIEEKTLNFDFSKLEKLIDKRTHGIIVQNTLGNPIDMEKMEKFAKKHHLLIIEDLAHSAGIKYPDGRKAGMVGVATVLSFGKDKAINTISGGAVILRDKVNHEVEPPVLRPRVSDHLRARFYPLFCAICRALNYFHLGGILMRGLIKIHFVEKSADNKLDIGRSLSKFQARLAMEQIKNFHHRGEGRLREFYFVKNRDEVLKKLRAAGYFFDAFWYEKPVSPKRYYKEVSFPEKDCPSAVNVSNKIINFPTYYDKNDLKKAFEIIEPYLLEDI